MTCARPYGILLAGFLAAAGVLVFFSAAAAQVVTATVSPASYSIPDTVTTTQLITYSFSTVPMTVPAASPRGFFLAGGTQVGVNNTPVSFNIVGGRGMATETLTVPTSAVQNALNLGSSTITYMRTFTGDFFPVTTQVTITITSESGAGFRITGMQLYFQNRMTTITVPRNDTALRAFVDLRYVGSGILQGYWEVDGNFLANVVQPVTAGRLVTFPSPRPPLLPTFSPGSHRVRFVISSPVQSIPFPEIAYYVTTGEIKQSDVVKIVPLKLLFPADGGSISPEAPQFQWGMRSGAALYFIEFRLRGAERLIFSAYTKSPQYSLPASELRARFVPGGTYTWKVIAFDDLHKPVAESPLFYFNMRE